jgi:hypothetical protein
MAMSTRQSGAPSPESFGGRTRAGITANVTVMIAVAVAIFTFVNYFAGQSAFRTYWDWTQLGSNTLSDKTLGLLEKLPETLGADEKGNPRVIELISFLEPRQYIDQKAAELVDQTIDVYRVKGKGRIVVTKFREFADLADARKKVKDLKLKEIPNTDEVVMAYGDRNRTLRLGDMVQIDHGMRGAMFGGRDEPARIEANKVEETITSSLLAIVDAVKPKAYFLAGHGEPDLDNTSQEEGIGRLADVLRSNGYDVAALNLAEKPAVPADAAVVVWIAPARPMDPKELDTLKLYARSGGRLVVAPELPLEPGRDADALALLAEYGIRSPNGLVCIPLVNPLTGQEVSGSPQAIARVFVKAADLSSVHPITKSYYEQRYNLQMPYSRAFERILDSKSEAFTEDLGRVPKDCWVDLEPMNYAFDDATETRGTKSVLTTATLKSSSTESGPSSKPASADGPVKEGRIVCIGSAVLARNVYFEFGRDLYLAAIEWTAGREYAAGIGPKPVQKNALVDTDALLARILIASSILTGLAFVGAGYVWYLRRGTKLGFIVGAAFGALPILWGVLSWMFSQAV